MVDERFCNLNTNCSFVSNPLDDKFAAVKRLQPICGDCKPAVLPSKVCDCAVVFSVARATVKHCRIGHHCRPCYMRIVEKMTLKNTMYMGCNGHKQLVSNARYIAREELRDTDFKKSTTCALVESVETPRYHSCARCATDVLSRTR
jgi:hypothetical protein